MTNEKQVRWRVADYQINQCTLTHTDHLTGNIFQVLAWGSFGKLFHDFETYKLAIQKFWTNSGVRHKWINQTCSLHTWALINEKQAVAVLRKGHTISHYVFSRYYRGSDIFVTMAANADSLSNSIFFFTLKPPRTQTLSYMQVKIPDVIPDLNLSIFLNGIRR